MKSIIKLTMVLALSLSVATFSSCNTTNALTKGVAPALLSKVGASLIPNISGLSGLGSLGSALGMNTKLSSVIKGVTLVNSFKGMLSNKYQIPAATVTNSFDKFTNLSSVAGFIAKNASSSVLAGL